MSSSEFNKLKDGERKSNGTTLRIGNKNFNKPELLNLYLPQSQINKLNDKIENNMSANIKLSKAQINRIIKSGGALGSILARFFTKINTTSDFIRKKILAPLGLSAAMSATDAAIQKKCMVIEQKL